MLCIVVSNLLVRSGSIVFLMIAVWVTARGASLDEYAMHDSCVRWFPALQVWHTNTPEVRSICAHD